jgi:hypothetical protein
MLAYSCVYPINGAGIDLEGAWLAMRKVFEGVLDGGLPTADERTEARQVMDRLIEGRVPVRKFQGDGGRPIGRLVRRVDDPFLGDFVAVLRTPSGSEVYADVRNLAYLEATLEVEPVPVRS